MSDMELAKLTEPGIRKVAGERIFSRGEAYYAGGAVHETVREGSAIRALCEGSRSSPYRVRAVLSESGIESASCTCPMDGFCKHIVAMLLKFIDEPDDFREMPPLEDILSSLSREEMASVISSMVECEPRLVTLVTRAAAKTGAANDLDGLRHDIREAMFGDDPFQILMRLTGIMSMAHKLAEKGDWHGAGSVYHELLRELAPVYEEYLLPLDDDGDIAALACDCVEGLEVSLREKGISKEARYEWFESLLDAMLADIHIGGVSFAEGSLDVLMDFAGEEDWLSLEPTVLDLIPASEGWTREALVNVLAAWRKKWVRSDEAREVIREKGSSRQKVFSLVQDGRFEEAVSLARAHLEDQPGVMLDLADALVVAKAPECAVELLLQYASSEKQGCYRFLCYRQWLAEYYRKSRNHKKALEWQRKLFFDDPSLEMFSVLQKLGKTMKVWQEVRAEALDYLETIKRFGVLIDIALYEGDIQTALDLLPRLPRASCPDPRLDVAQAAEKTLPLEAIRLYKDLAEKAIALRHRESYGMAARYLVCVKKLYEKLDRIGEWREDLASLKNRYTRLPALQNELKKAGL
ncbi:MAG TPA: SWIM zinc finger family protein [Thermovirgaceae bacterium]|mgnify:CR=1 FL=1|nr:SWIM zinc finger family protein [Thermovirgaceae bacterium]